MHLSFLNVVLAIFVVLLMDSPNLSVMLLEEKAYQ